MNYKSEWRYVEIENPQHVRGGLYRRHSVTKRITVCIMSAKFGDASDLADLAIMSDRLGVPIKWNADTTPQTFSISVTVAP